MPLFGLLPGASVALAQQPQTLRERCIQKAGGTFDRSAGVWRRVKSRIVYKTCLAGRDPRTPLKTSR
jgi:hypothetical protein